MLQPRLSCPHNFSRIKPSVKTVNKDSDLGKDLDLDSLDTMNFLFEVEKVFDINIPESDISENELFNINKINSVRLG